MTRRLRVPYSLRRKRVRASFSKYSVYNAMTWRKDRPRTTQHRQLFFAKQESRAYHGDRLTERQFKNHFRGEQPVLAPLARARGTEAETPFGLQTYVALERRLDFAVFRAFFASSVRQAASFILKGSVLVNGVRVRSPGYRLRPNDVFSVTPLRVLQALGRPKPAPVESVKLTNRIISRFNKYLERCRARPEAMHAQRVRNRARHHEYAARHAARADRRVGAQLAALEAEHEQARQALSPARVLRAVVLGEFAPRRAVQGTLSEIRALYDPATDLLDAGVGAVSPSADAVAAAAGDGAAGDGAAAMNAGETATRNADTAETLSAARNAADATRPQAASTAEAEGQKSAPVPAPGGDPGAAAAPSSAAAASATPRMEPAHTSNPKLGALLTRVCESELAALDEEFAQRRAALDPDAYDPAWVDRLPAPLEPLPADADPRKARAKLPFSTTGGRMYGLSEPGKPYFTPWSPRQFVAPFAVLPHHIEICFESCHAVYMRDPVARPGLSEVISPFSLDMHERAYLWYVARRRKNLPRLD